MYESNYTRKSVSDYKILEIAQIPSTRVVFDVEQEYETLGCHISSMSHVTPEKVCQITKF